jgi:hypothetical protein
MDTLDFGDSIDPSMLWNQPNGALSLDAAFGTASTDTTGVPLEAISMTPATVAATSGSDTVFLLLGVVALALMAFSEPEKRRK